MPAWALTIAYWLHMAASISWVGGLFYQATILNPILHESDDPGRASHLLHRLHKRFHPIAWFSLAILIATGLTQMAGNPNYVGFLEVTNRWSAAILAKHVVIGLMVLAAAYQTWFLGPALERALLLQARRPEGAGKPSTRRYARLTGLNLVLGILVLGLTALARTA